MTFEEYKKDAHPGRRVKVVMPGRTFQGIAGRMISATGIQYIIALNNIGTVEGTEDNYHLVQFEALH